MSRYFIRLRSHGKDVAGCGRAFCLWMVRSRKLGCGWKTGRHDENHNVASAHTTLTDTRNSLIMTQGAHLAVHGLEGIAVIASEDAVYVGRLHDSQNVRKVVSLLAAAPETARLTELHPTTCRPWGDCTTILNGEHFQVRRITVRPGKRLSLQRHRHRCEHWIVIKGTAEVTIANRCKY